MKGIKGFVLYVCLLESCKLFQTNQWISSIVTLQTKHLQKISQAEFSRAIFHKLAYRLTVGGD